MGIQYRQLQAKRRRTGKNPGTMIDMAADDIVDSGFTQDGNAIKALDFDGVNDMVDCGNDSSLQITNNLSVFTWVEAGAQGTSDYIAQKYYTNQLSWLMKSDGTDATKLYVQISDDGATTEPSCKKYISPTATLSAGWHQVGFTFASNVLKIYVDGVDITATCDTTVNSTVNTLHNSTRNLEIAGFNGDSNANWTGKMVNFSIWDTEVLAQADVTALYNGGPPIDPRNLSKSGSQNLVSSYMWNTKITYPTIVDNVK